MPDTDPVTYCFAGKNVNKLHRHCVSTWRNRFRLSMVLRARAAGRCWLSLAMSLVTGRPFVIENIRAGRKKPGLMRQHVTAVFSGFGQLNVRAEEVATVRLDQVRSTISPPAFRSARTWPIN